MTKILVEEGYQLSLPLELQPLAPVGSQFQVTVDEAGRIILTPEAHIRAILMEASTCLTKQLDIVIIRKDVENSLQS